MATAGNASPTGIDPSDEATAQRFAAAIDSGDGQGPQSPGTLSVRLGFADFLAKSEGGDCHVRLERAQEQLHTVRTSASVAALPLASAREAAVDYQIHRGLAACDVDGPSRDQQRRAAVDAASLAVEAYRNDFDAVGTATMQFNLALAYHDLSDGAAALTALQAAIDTDREYGFADDARDNYQTLLQWQDQPAGTDAVDTLMKDFPQRSVSLFFAWSNSESDLTATLDYEQHSDEGTLQIHGTKGAQCRIRRQSNGWNVTFEPRATQYQLSQWPANDSAVQGTALSLIRLPLPFHNFELSRFGDFAGSADSSKFESGVRADARQLSDILLQNKVDARVAGRIRNSAFNSVRSIDALVAESYNLAAGTWIGASLEQGVWYDMKVPLSMPLLPGLSVTYQVQFAFTRELPCVAGSAATACVEIVLRAAPDAAELARLLANLSQTMRMGRKDTLQASAAVYLRLVTDPKTLQFYGTDQRRYSYWTTRGTPQGPVAESERTTLVSGSLTPVG